MSTIIEFSHPTLSFSVKPGEWVGIVGPSGSGKSSALRIIAGLERSPVGTFKLPGSAGIVFRSDTTFPWLNVADNVAFGLRAKGVRGIALSNAVKYFLDLTRLQGLERLPPSEIPRSDRQRVCIARALAANPAVLLLDDAFADLDARSAADLHDDLLNIWAYTRQTIVMVSHSIEEAVTLAERVLLMKEFRIVREFDITTRHPRRDHQDSFIREVHDIRREFII